MAKSAALDPELGALLSEHGPARGARILSFTLGVSAFGAFALAAFQNDELTYGALALGMGLVYCVVTQRLLSGIRLRIFEHGIERRGPLGTRRIAWRALQTYQLQLFDSTTTAAGGVGGLLGALLVRAIAKAVNKSAELTPNAVVLYAQDGTKIALSANATGYKDLTKTLVPALAERIFPAANQAFETGAELSFGKKLKLQRGVGVTFTGAFGKKYVLPLEQAGSAALERTVLVIRHSETNAVWQSIPATSVRNLGVFQKFVEMKGTRYEDRLPLAWTS